jgi:hypothetical protein
MSRNGGEEDREQSYKNFQEEVEKEISNPGADGGKDSGDAPFGVCFQNQMWACTPACVAHLPYDEGPDGEPLGWGDRCEILVSKRLQARALVLIERHLVKLTSGKPTPPAATDGPEPPPHPAGT